VARRIGTIQTLSDEEQQRLADEGILDTLTGPAPSATSDGSAR
jgi:hypothetical protein